MIRQKSKFWTFIFSMCPGGGHLYLGFRRRGLALLIAFCLGMGLAIVSDLAVLSIICIIVWIVSFFEAMNFNSIPPEAFATLEDRYIYEDAFPKAQNRDALVKYAGYACIFTGLAILWNSFTYTLIAPLYDANPWLYNVLYQIVDSVPRVVICILIIIIGFRLVRGKKHKAETPNE